MTFKYTAVPLPKNPKNVWELVVSFMHGDGDDTTTGELQYDSEAEMAKDYAILKDIEGYSFSRRDNGIPEDFEDFIPYDKFSDGNCKAMVEGVEIFYYDENGVKFSGEAK
jgi:hypothetical protein